MDPISNEIDIAAAPGHGVELVSNSEEVIFKHTVSSGLGGSGDVLIFPFPYLVKSCEIPLLGFI